MKKSVKKKNGFTLAEVLITLAIIGIVAALTIPTLIQNYQERAWNTASQVFQRKLGEALKIMNVQGTLAGYTTTEAFVDELSKHIKITRICDKNTITTCFAGKVIWGDEEVDMRDIKKAKHFGQDDWGTDLVGAQFANGVNGVIAYNPDCRQNQFSNDVITVGENGISTDCLAILYDVDGFKNPNTADKDINNLNVDKLANLLKCSIKLSDDTCFTAPFIPTSVTKAECEQLIAGGYPIKECYQNYDSWAGAVKACHDRGSRLPSDTELMKLAEELYKDASGTAFPGNRDNNKVVEMGFGKILSDNTFWVWSSKENGEFAVISDFESARTHQYSYLRNRNNCQAVCLAE